MLQQQHIASPFFSHLDVGVEWTWGILFDIDCVRSSGLFFFLSTTSILKPTKSTIIVINNPNVCFGGGSVMFAHTHQQAVCWHSAPSMLSNLTFCQPSVLL